MILGITAENAGRRAAAPGYDLTMPVSPRLVAAGAIVDDLDRPSRLLAARRSAPKSLTGRWEFAGGKVEPGETAQAALHRELAEELGIRVRLGQEITPTAPITSPHGANSDGTIAWPILNDLFMRIWFARIIEGEPAPLADHDALEWLPITNLHSVPWLEPDLPIVDAIASRA